MDMQEHVGRKLYLARVEAGMPQSELAARLGCTSSAISHWEVGRNFPSFELLVRICREFNKSLDWLLEGSEGVDSFTGTRTLGARPCSGRHRGRSASRQ